MPNMFAELAFTDAVRAEQTRQGSRESYARMDDGPAYHDRLGENEAAFIAIRDSFYMATVSETGWPYIQHRGGPPGFVKILDEKTLGFADFRGNRQYISLGNLQGDDRVSLFFMDYPRRARLKMLGRVTVTEDPAQLSRLALPDYRAKPERGMLITIDAFDWNCPQHITPRFTEPEIAQAVAPLHARIKELEAQLAAKG